jgi:tetratricopeptide (TPR) repeat protein
LDKLRGEISKLEFTQKDLLTRAADYFAQARKPRTEWKKLDDLVAQLAEYDLRCAAGDFNTATEVLIDVDFDYLLLWGHYRLTIDLHEKLQGKFNDLSLSSISIGNLGTAYSRIGQLQKAITLYEKALSLVRERKDRDSEGVWLDNLGTSYIELGNINKAIDLFEQALVISMETGYKRGEGTRLHNIAQSYFLLGDINHALTYFEKALSIRREISDLHGIGSTLGNLARVYCEKENYKDAIQFAEDSIVISQELNSPLLGARHTYTLALANLLSENLKKALIVIERANGFEVPEQRHNISALHGIIALREADVNVARQAFTSAIAQADEILAKTPDFYSALDAKGLALCGLVLTKDLTGLRESRPDVEGADEDLSGLITQAIETFRAARKIAPHAGIVKAALRLFDELAKCDPEGLLA